MDLHTTPILIELPIYRSRRTLIWPESWVEGDGPSLGAPGRRAFILPVDLVGGTATTYTLADSEKTSISGETVEPDINNIANVLRSQIPVKIGAPLYVECLDASVDQTLRIWFYVIEDADWPPGGSCE